MLSFVLAAMAEKFAGRILLHEFQFLSNHFHLLLTDIDGCLPEFMCELDSLLTRNLNAIHGESGSGIEGYNAVAVQDDDKVLEHAVYTLANVCSAHLVRRAAQWDGPSSDALEYGETLAVERPNDGIWKYADDRDRRHRKRRQRRSPMNAERGRRRCRTKMPKVARMQLVRPPGFQQLSDAQLRRLVRERLEKREDELIRQRRRQGRKVLGMRKVRLQPYWASPRNTEDMFRTTPSVSGRSKWARIEALARRAEFIEVYRQARDAFRAGERDVVFPHGTWLMKQRFDVRCHSP